MPSSEDTDSFADGRCFHGCNLTAIEEAANLAQPGSQRNLGSAGGDLKDARRTPADHSRKHEKS
jgi:hypothetical protein